MKEFTWRARAAGPGHERGPGRRQRLPRTARRPDHRRHLSRRGHRHGRAAPGQRLDSRREHRANRRLHRRIGGRRRGLHPARLLSWRKRLALLRFQPTERLLEIHRADAGRLGARRAVRLADPPRDGGRSRAALPRIGGRLAKFTRPDRPARAPPSTSSTTSASAPLVFLARRIQLVRARSRFLLPRRPARQEHAAAGRARIHPGARRRRRLHLRRAHRQPAPTSASATSSDRNWPRSISPAA